MSRLGQILGTVGLPASPDAEADAVRAVRVASARKNAKWKELRASDLVRRPGGVLVDEPSDLVYRPYSGVIFGKGTGRIEFNEGAPLAFFVMPDGELGFVEQVGNETWTEIVKRREARRLKVVR